MPPPAELSSQPEGIALAVELARIAAEEADKDGAPAEAEELRRVHERLRAHRDSQTHVHTIGGRPELWRADGSRD